MTAVDVVGRLPGLVGAVQQAAIFRVPQEELSQTAASPANGNVERGVPSLGDRRRGTNAQYINTVKLD